MKTKPLAIMLISLAAATAALAQQPPAAVPAEPPAQEAGGKKDEPSHPAHPGTQDKDLVEKGIFPKSINIPGTDASFSIGGYAKVDFIKDFDSIGNAYDFQTNSIPVAGSAAADLDGRTTIHARETRINLEFRAAKRFRAFVEGDFYGDGNAFRLRHAYGEFGRLLGGQTWSTFQDISARPLTIDFEGPDGEIFVRQALLRWTQPLSKAVKWAIAVENPTPNIAVPSGETGVAQSECAGLRDDPAPRGSQGPRPARGGPAPAAIRRRGRLARRVHHGMGRAPELQRQAVRQGRADGPGRVR